MVFSDWWTIASGEFIMSLKKKSSKKWQEKQEKQTENRRKQKKKRSCIYSPRGCILRRLYSIIFILLLMNFRQMAPLGVSNIEIQGSNPFSTTLNVLKNSHHFIDILRLTLYLIFYPNDFLSILIWQILGTKKGGYKTWEWW